MDATRRQRVIRGTTLIALGMGGTLLVSLDPAHAWRAPGFLVASAGAVLWTIAENLALQQDEPASYRGRRNTRLLQGAVLVGFVVAAFDAFHLPENALPRGWLVAIAGGLVLAGGAALRVWSIRVLAAHFRYELRVEREQRLVNRGPYRVLRHPSYLGLLLIVLGAALAYGSVLGMLVGGALTATFLVLRIRDEEQVLRDAYGEAYSAYSKRTWRLVPFVY